MSTLSTHEYRNHAPARPEAAEVRHRPDRPVRPTLAPATAQAPLRRRLPGRPPRARALGRGVPSRPGQADLHRAQRRARVRRVEPARGGARPGVAVLTGWRGAPARAPAAAVVLPRRPHEVLRD